MKLLRFFHRYMADPVAIYRKGNKLLIRLIYNVSFRDIAKNVPLEGPAVLICNHVSYMDGLVIDAAIDRPVRFVIDAHIYNAPGVHYFMSMYEAIPILPERTSVEAALDLVSEALKKGELVCVFPEGQLTYTGNMSRFRFGVEWIVQRDPVPVVPMALKGLWGSVLSRKYRRSRLRWLPRSFRRKVVLAAGEPMDPHSAHISHMQRVIMALKNRTSL